MHLPQAYRAICQQAVTLLCYCYRPVRSHSTEIFCFSGVFPFPGHSTKTRSFSISFQQIFSSPVVANRYFKQSLNAKEEKNILASLAHVCDDNRAIKPIYCPASRSQLGKKEKGKEALCNYFHEKSKSYLKLYSFICLNFTS